MRRRCGSWLNSFRKQLAGRETGISSYKDAVALARAEAEAERKPFREYEKGEFGYDAGQEIIKWWQALQLDRIDIHSAIDPTLRADGVWGYNRKDMSLTDVLRAMPNLIGVAARGETETMPTTLYCAPKWRKGRVGIMMDDVSQPEFLAKYPPNAIVATSDRKPQAFWVLDRKYPEQQFYDDFMHWLNANHGGDPKILKQGHDTRLAGFYNRKHFMQDGSGRTPKVHVKESSTRRPVEMEQLLEEYRRTWEQGRLELAKSEGTPKTAQKSPVTPVLGKSSPTP